MGREERQAEPRFLVEETRVEAEYGGSKRTDRHWHTYAEYHEVEAHLAATDKPGYGTDCESITYRVYDLTVRFLSMVEVAPQTMLDLALPLVEYASNGCTRLGIKVKVGVELRDARRTPTTFWSSDHNSYVIVRPSGDPARANAEGRLTSDQGVMLLSVNGIGEIRWDVDGGRSGSGGDAEAVAHFGLTWTARP